MISSTLEKTTSVRKQVIEQSWNTIEAEKITSDDDAKQTVTPGKKR
jgi:hypothetical protein